MPSSAVGSSNATVVPQPLRRLITPTPRIFGFDQTQPLRRLITPLSGVLDQTFFQKVCGWPRRRQEFSVLIKHHAALESEKFWGYQNKIFRVKYDLSALEIKARFHLIRFHFRQEALFPDIEQHLWGLYSYFYLFFYLNSYFFSIFSFYRMLRSSF